MFNKFVYGNYFRNALVFTARTTILTNQVQLCVFDISPASKPSAASPRIIIESQGNCALTLD